MAINTRFVLPPASASPPATPPTPQQDYIDTMWYKQELENKLPKLVNNPQAYADTEQAIQALEDKLAKLRAQLKPVTQPKPVK